MALVETIDATASLDGLQYKNKRVQYSNHCYLRNYFSVIGKAFELFIYILLNSYPSIPLLLLLFCPPRVEGTEIIRLGVILPHKPQYPWFTGRILPGMRYAVETIHNRSNILMNQELQLNVGDSQCSETYGPLVAIDMYLKKMAHVFIGPYCDYSVAPIARLSPHWGIPVITAGALVTAFENKSEYQQLTRISGSYAKLGTFFTQMFHRFNWDMVGLIYNDYLESSRSDCFFVMEAVYQSIRKAKMKNGTKREDIWYKSFDDRAKSTPYNLTAILLEGSLKTRSK